MDDSDLEILEGSPSAPTVLTTPRPTQRPKTVIRPGPKAPAAAAGQLPGPQAIHPVGSPDLPLSLERLERLKGVLESKTVCFLHFPFFCFLVIILILQLRHMCANCIVREGLSCDFNGWGIDCNQCAQAKRGHCSFKTDPRKRVQTTSRLYDASTPTSRSKPSSFNVSFALFRLICLFI